MVAPAAPANSQPSQGLDMTLPPVPTGLKHISPYIQRAVELHSKDPVMTYWCLYYAAKHGVAANVGRESREFLLKLMDVLEKTKRENADNDAVARDEDGSAYITKFASRIFNTADNEDRRGAASRHVSTAKKFLAAANFLELLSVFESSNQAENEQKIRYSKWKAADIAKAFREGRQPTPGPAGSAFEDIIPGSSSSTSGLLSPPLADSAFGSIPPSISASPLRASQLPLPGSPAQNGDKPLPITTEDITPVSSPKATSRRLNATSPERAASPPQPGLFSTPTPPHTIRTNGISPGGWSSLATPGQDDPVRWSATPGASSSLNVNLFGRVSSPTRLEHAQEDEEEEVVIQTLNGSSGSEGDDVNAPDSPSARLSALPSRQTSWSSTIANAGDGPSRSSSLQISPTTPTDFQRPGVVRQGTLSAIPEAPSVVPSSENGSLDSGEAADQITPLPSALWHGGEEREKKAVRFTPSVVGGLSSVASSSGWSPAGVTEIPLPESDSSFDGEDDDGDTKTLMSSGEATVIPSVKTWIASTAPNAVPVAQPHSSIEIDSLPNGISSPRGRPGVVVSPRLHPLPLGDGGSSLASSSANGSSPPPLPRHDSASPPGVHSSSPRLRTADIPPISISTSPPRPLIPEPPSILPSAPPASSILPLLPPPTSFVAPPPPPPAAVTSTSKYAYPPTPYPRQAPSLAPTPAMSSKPLPEELTLEENMKAKKAAKYAISALEYDDLETARKQLILALGVLGIEVPMGGR